MNNDKHNIDLESLLAAMEHAGRDERRRQELGDMFDRMAGVENGERKRGVWWWTTRVAAAACILFFVSTAIRIWFIPTENGNMLVAEVMDVPSLSTEEVDSMPVPTTPAPVRPVAARRAQPVVVRPAVVEEIRTEEEVFYVEADEEAAPVEADTTMVTPPIIENDITPEVQLAAVVEDVEEISEPVPQPEKRPKKNNRRRSILASLFRFAEPSEMDGTTLALLEF